MKDSTRKHRGRGRRAKGQSNNREGYLKIPFHLLQRRDVSMPGKIVYAYVYGFGLSGCWDSNDNIARTLGLTRPTVSRAVMELWHLQVVYLFGRRARSRKLFAVTHPHVEAVMTVRWVGRDVPKEQGRYKSGERTQKASQVNHFEPVTVNDAQLNQNDSVSESNCASIIKYKKVITAPPAPLPADGQASAELDHKEQKARGRLERFRDRLCNRGNHSARLSPIDFERRRELLKQALGARTQEQAAGVAMV